MQDRTRGTGWGILPLRLMIGFGFAAHGYAKLSRGPENFATILLALGIPQPHVTAWVTSLIELTGGLFLMAGAFVVPLSFPLAIVMLTALFNVHLRYGFSSIRLQAVTASGAVFGPVGYEINLLYIAGLATLTLLGPGKLSVDRFLQGRNALRVAEASRARPAGAVAAVTRPGLAGSSSRGKTR